MKRTICVFTGTRAEFGLLRNVLSLLKQNPQVDTQLLVSGMHLAPEFGLTFREIEEHGFKIDERVEMLVSSDTPVGICKSMGLGLIGLSEALQRLTPDLLVVLGDRYEALCVATCATILRIPIAHLFGGEATHGLIDEPIRHSITKMSHLHFTSTETYRRRVIQLGEDPRRVFCVGALGVENAQVNEMIPREQLEADLGFSLARPFALVTMHPVTLQAGASAKQCAELLGALAALSLPGVFTSANADTEGRIINDQIHDYVSSQPERGVLHTSLGYRRYLSTLAYASVVVGNSSSGLVEAPALRVPTVDIGLRQAGRVRPSSVVHCKADKDSIRAALEKALSTPFRAACAEMNNPYEGTHPSQAIHDALVNANLEQIVLKSFYDVGFDLPHGL